MSSNILIQTVWWFKLCFLYDLHVVNCFVVTIAAAWFVQRELPTELIFLLTYWMITRLTFASVFVERTWIVFWTCTKYVHVCVPIGSIFLVTDIWLQILMSAQILNITLVLSMELAKTYLVYLSVCAPTVTEATQKMGPARDLRATKHLVLEQNSQLVRP